MISLEFIIKDKYTQREQVEEIKRIFTTDAANTHGQVLYKFTMGLVGLHRDRNKECYAKLIQEFVNTYEVFTDVEAQQYTNSILEKSLDRDLISKKMRNFVDERTQTIHVDQLDEFLGSLPGCRPIEIKFLHWACIKWFSGGDESGTRVSSKEFLDRWTVINKSKAPDQEQRNSPERVYEGNYNSDQNLGRIVEEREDFEETVKKESNVDNNRLGNSGRGGVDFGQGGEDDDIDDDFMDEFDEDGEFDDSKK